MSVFRLSPDSCHTSAKKRVSEAQPYVRDVESRRRPWIGRAHLVRTVTEVLSVHLQPLARRCLMLNLCFIPRLPVIRDAPAHPRLYRAKHAYPLLVELQPARLEQALFHSPFEVLLATLIEHAPLGRLWPVQSLGLGVLFRREAAQLVRQARGDTLRAMSTVTTWQTTQELQLRYVYSRSLIQTRASQQSWAPSEECCQ